MGAFIRRMQAAWLGFTDMPVCARAHSPTHPPTHPHTHTHTHAHAHAHAPTYARSWAQVNFGDGDGVTWHDVNLFQVGGGACSGGDLEMEEPLL